ncbi:DUF6624 domain-containing protein [Flavobacterium pedocola]
MKKILTLIFALGTCFSQAQDTKYAEVIKEINTVDMALKMGSIKFLQVVMQSGAASKEARNFWVMELHKDSSSVQTAKKILDAHGFLGEAEIGKKASQTLYKRILRSDVKAMEKYLPVFRDAFAKNKLSGEDLAIFEDLLLVKKGLSQKYGTQQGQLSKGDEIFFLPIQDVEQLDAIRSKELKLKPIKDEYFNWDFDKYKKNLKKSQKFLEHLSK